MCSGGCPCHQASPVTAAADGGLPGAPFCTRTGDDVKPKSQGCPKQSCGQTHLPASVGEERGTEPWHILTGVDLQAALGTGDQEAAPVLPDVGVGRDGLRVLGA